MPAKLVITRGLLLGREEMLQRDTVIVGRSASCDISVPDEQVSRRHVQLDLREGRWHAQDLQSANGTFVNERRLGPGEVARLRLGDRVSLGGGVEFTLMEAIGVAPGGGEPVGSHELPPLVDAVNASRRRPNQLWIGLGALLLITLIVGGAFIWRNLTRDDVESTASGAPIAPLKSSTMLPAIVTQQPPAELPAPTVKPRSTAEVKASGVKPVQLPKVSQGAQGAQNAQAAQVAGMAGAVAMAGQLEQLPALISQAFPGVPSDQLPGAIMQALQSGQIKPEAAQGFIQVLFPNVPSAQLPAALAGSFAGFNIPQIQGILQAIYPGVAVNLPNVNSRTGAVAFAALDDSGRTHIYQMNADGSAKQLLIEDASEPSFSHDGKRLAYFSARSNAVGLRIRNMDTGETTTLTSSENDAYPSWSPDGDRLVFWDLADNTIVVINADGTGRQGITRGEFPDWSPRGDRIALKSCVSNDCGIVLVNSDGSNPQRITTNANDGQPAWSPDGRNLAFVSNRDGNWEIYAINADGAWLRRITDDVHTDGLPTWSADGLRIAFRSDRDGRWAVYTATGVGGPPFKLVDAPVQSTGRWQWTWEKLSWR